MAHYTCPNCGVRSDNVVTQAEANELLVIHRKYFCRPVRRTATPTPAPATRGRRR
ncbi:hypothetical protein [Pseudofrankia sp. BMG5.36]|uniref:hypothetical protein n=1 Tax=Pseudofrankia sp. BMG5.36 TaxID=1834512 RepID=UPI0018E30317|nr:hypothetical protein [Pseudofrankia sp. BMG5.36]